MKQAAINYGKALFETGIASEVVENARSIYEESSQLQKILDSPVVDYESKVKVVERIFPKEICGFMKLICYYHKARHLTEIFQVFEELNKEKKSVLSAVLYYTVMPSEAHLVGMKEFLQKKYQKEQVELKLVQDISLIGGFLLQVGNMQYDCSTRGAMESLRQKLVRR